MPRTEISIALKHGDSCNMNCAYCVSHLDNSKQKVQINERALIQAIVECDVWKNRKPNDPVLFNLWGGEPLLKTEVLEYLMDLISSIAPGCEFFISTNGLNFATSKVQEFIKRNKHRIGLQLSHDGLGQCYRSKVDPLAVKKISDAFAKFARERPMHFIINCTQSGKNPSVLGNFAYFNKWLLDNNLLEYEVKIKLNHINDSRESSGFSFDEETVRQYFHEYELLYLDCLRRPNDPLIRVYSGYFISQMERNFLFHKPGACSAFALGLTDNNWSMNTLGEYIICQLWDTNEGLPNPNCEMPDYCKGCEYEKYYECHPCPTNTFPDKCVYRKEFMRMVMRAQAIKSLVGVTREENTHC